jgi:hypothetical protein
MPTGYRMARLSPAEKATKLYDRTGDEIEKIQI